MWISFKRRLTFLIALALVWPAMVIAPIAQAVMLISCFAVSVLGMGELFQGAHSAVSVVKQRNSC